MSLINEMLQDLEQRQAGPPAGSQLAPVRQFAEAGSRSAAGLSASTVAIVLLTLAAITLSWLLIRDNRFPGQGSIALAPVGVATQPTRMSQGPVMPSPPEPTPPQDLPQPQPQPQPQPRTEQAVLQTQPQFAPAPRIEVPPNPVSVRAAPATEASGRRQAKAGPASGPVAPPAAAPAARVDAPARAATPAPVLAASATGNGTPVKKDEGNARKAEQLYQQAKQENAQGQQEAALKSLRAALELQPRHVQARLGLSKLLADRKQAGPAAELLTDGLMLLPQESAFALALAPLWMQAGQQDDAMALLAQGSKSANGDPQYHAYYGAQLARLKRHPEAAAHYRTALRAEPSNAEWLVALGISLQASGSLPEALSAFRRAQEIGTLPPQLKTMVQQVVATLSPQVPTDSPRQP